MLGCPNGRPTVKITVRTSADVIRTSARGHGFTCGQVFTVHGRSKNRVPVGVGPHGLAPVRTWRGCADASARMPHVRTDAGPGGRGSAQTRDCADAHRHASRGRGFRGGPEIRALHIKGGALPLFPHFQPIPIE
jgi:hypothetical protein